MREIIFRGKRKDNGEWIFGYYFQKQNPLSEDGFPITHHISDFPPFGVEVDTETVGQYTGMTDKAGQKIFEGDIVLAHFRNNRSKQKFCVTFDDGMFLFDNNHVKVPMYDIYCMNVIGNIHDNP